MINVGDRVLIKSREWYDENKDRFGNVPVPHSFTAAMAQHCGRTLRVTDVLSPNTYELEGNSYLWSEEMFETVYFDVEDLFEQLSKIKASVSSDSSSKSDKNVYPKTYKMCCKTLGIVPALSHDDILSKFDRLRTVRNAYWKISNSQPDWANSEQKKFVVIVDNGKVVKETITTGPNQYFAFTDEKARDFLYEYFIDLLKECRDYL